MWEILAPLVLWENVGSTRGIIAGGSMVATIRFITIQTQGNSAGIFGDLTDSRYAGGPFSNSVRAVFGGG